MHARLGEPAKGAVRQVRVVHDPGDDQRGGAVLQEIDLAGQSGILLLQALEQVVDGPGHTVAPGLPGDHHGVVPAQLLHQRLVPSSDPLSFRVAEDLRAQDGGVLGQRVAALDLDIGPALSGHGVEEDGLSGGKTP